VSEKRIDLSNEINYLQRKGYSDPDISTSVAKPPEKISVAVNTPARVEIDVNKTKQTKKRAVTSSAKALRPRRDETTEYRTRYKPQIDPKDPRIPKAYEAEQIDERVRSLYLKEFFYLVCSETKRN
jgi:hypothetical protein